MPHSGVIAAARSVCTTAYAIDLSADGWTTGAEACVDVINITYYKTTNTLTVQSGDIIYYDSCSQSPLLGGDQFFSDGTNSFRVSNTGTVSNFATCI